MGCALEPDLAVVRSYRARDDLDQGRLAGAVLADEGVDLAAAQLERGPAQRVHAGVGLRQAPHVEQGLGLARARPCRGRRGAQRGRVCRETPWPNASSSPVAAARPAATRSLTCSSHGYQVLNVDLRPLEHPGVHTLIADVADGGQVFNALTSHLNMAGFEKPGGRRPPDAVVHFAAHRAQHDQARRRDVPQQRHEHVSRDRGGHHARRAARS